MVCLNHFWTVFYIWVLQTTHWTNHSSENYYWDVKLVTFETLYVVIILGQNISHFPLIVHKMTTNEKGPWQFYEEI